MPSFRERVSRLSEIRTKRVRDMRAARASNSKAIRREALRRISDAMISAGADQPPVDLRRLARHLDVSDIRIVPLAMRGRLTTENGRLVIEINEELGDGDQKFTLGHELAHVILERDRTAIAASRGHNVLRAISHGVIEQLCDLGAAEMLLPEAWLHQRLACKPRAMPSMELVVDIAGEIGLSIDFVLSRILDCELRPWRALWVGMNGDRFHILRSIPHWDAALACSIRMCEGRGAPLRTCYDSQEIALGEIVLTIFDDQQRYPVQCMRLNDDVALCLLKTGPG